MRDIYSTILEIVKSNRLSDNSPWLPQEARAVALRQRPQRRHAPRHLRVGVPYTVASGVLTQRCVGWAMSENAERLIRCPARDAASF